MSSVKSIAQRHSTGVRYAVALLSVVVALFIRWLLDPTLGGDLGFLTVFGAVALAVWFGRWKPALLAATVGYVGAEYLFFRPAHGWELNVRTGAAFGGYLLSTGMIIWLGELMHRARDRAEAESAERRLAQEAVARQKELLTTTLGSIGDAVIATDIQGRVSFLNAEAERLTGWASTEAAGKPLPEVFHILNEHTRQPVENPVEKVFRTGTVVGMANHTVLIAKDGTETPIDDSAAPIRQTDGSLSGVILVFRDFTAQKRAQEADARLAAIVEFSGDAIFTKNLKGVVQSWNASAEKLFGYRPEEIIGKPVTTLFPSDRLNEEDVILANLRQGLPVERLETIRVAKDGRKIPVSISVSPIKDPEGHVIGASKIVHDITDLVATREELIREKELLKTTLASIGDAVILTDAEGCVTYLNAEAERLTKWNTVQAAGLPLPQVFRIINEDTRLTVENPVEKVLRLGTVVALANHTVLIAKDGTETPIDDSAAPIRHAGGPLHGVVLVFRDFTERKQAEEALRESENLFRALVTTSSQCVWHYRRGEGPSMRHLRHGTTAWWEDFTGQSEAEQTKNGGLGWLATVHPDDVETAAQNVRNIESASAPTSMEFRVRRRDGAWRWILARGIPMRFEDGIVVERAGTMTDITDHKEAQEKLEELLARLDSLITYAPIVIALFDLELRFISINDRGAEVNGLTKEAHIGKTPGELMPKIGPEVETLLRQVRDTGEPLVRCELAGETPAQPGVLRHWIASYYPVRHPDGRVLGIGAIALEVTEQKRAQESLRGAHEQLASRAVHLEQLVQQRTARLNEMVGDLEAFSYSIVHDMRGPLRAMNSFTQLLQEECGTVSPTAENYMNRIRTATVRMDRLIQDGLNYSRLMRAELPLVPLDAAALVRGMVDTYPSLQPPHAEIELVGDFPLVKANEASLTQGVSNLLGNAVKFVASGVHPHVRVSAEARGDHVRLLFQDNGIGIPTTAHERIFQIFQRLDNSYEGTGIGLAIVKKAAERMGGTVGLESEPGKGSTFWIELPRAENVGLPSNAS